MRLGHKVRRNRLFARDDTAMTSAVFKVSDLEAGAGGGCLVSPCEGDNSPQK